MPDKPVLDRKKPFAEVRDRTMPNVKYQQADNLFDRKGNFYKKADFALEMPEPPPPQVTVRDIATRRIGTTKSIVEKVTDLVVGDKVIATTAAPEKRGRGRPPGSKNKTPGVDDVVRQAARENATARAVEASA